MAQSLLSALQNSGLENIRLDFQELPADPPSFLFGLEKTLTDRGYSWVIDNLPLECFDSEVAGLVSRTSRHKISFSALAPSQRLRDWIRQEVSFGGILKISH